MSIKNLPIIENVGIETSRIEKSSKKTIIECFECGDGHHIKDCIKAVCVICKQLGHWKKDCEKYNPNYKPKEHKPCCPFCKARELEHEHTIDACTELAKHECGNCRQLGHTRARCLEPSKKHKPFCPFCKARELDHQHAIDDCNELAKHNCKKCGKTGHTLSRCTKEFVPFCRYCKKEGHLVSECTEIKKRKCGLCGESHSTRECDSPYIVQNRGR